MGGMDRLTVWEHNDRGGKWSYHMDASVNDLCAKLAAYEDTGLTPTEIAAMRDELAAMGAENDMLKDTMIRACVWLDVHGRPGIPDVTRTLSEAVAATVKKEAHNEP